MTAWDDDVAEAVRCALAGQCENWPLTARTLAAEVAELRSQTKEMQQSARFWQGLAEYWEREHNNTVLPYTNKLESERDALKAKLVPH